MVNQGETHCSPLLHLLLFIFEILRSARARGSRDS